tara:strand:+ start:459 stop:1316 length:858 start_codon:yes stop_codon:yes gene_type:complete
MLSNKQFSIIIITKNNVKELQHTLESLAPFYKKEIDSNFFELLIIDKSNNKLVENLSLDYKNSIYKNIQYIRQHDKGIFFAFNIGIKKAIGRYLWFLNSGDTFSNEIDVNVFLNNILNFNGSMLIYKTKIYSLLLKKKIGEQPICFPRNIIIYKLLYSILPFAFGFCHQSTIIKRDFHLENLYKFPNMIGQDSNLIEKVIRSGDFKLLNKNLSNFYMGGISSSIPKTKKIFIKILKDRLKNWQLRSSISLIIKNYFFRNNYQLESAIYFRNKVLRKIFLFLNFLK